VKISGDIGNMCSQRGFPGWWRAAWRHITLLAHAKRAAGGAGAHQLTGQYLRLLCQPSSALPHRLARRNRTGCQMSHHDAAAWRGRRRAGALWKQYGANESIGAIINNGHRGNNGNEISAMA